MRGRMRGRTRALSLLVRRVCPELRSDIEEGGIGDNEDDEADAILADGGVGTNGREVGFHDDEATVGCCRDFVLLQVSRPSCIQLSS